MVLVTYRQVITYAARFGRRQSTLELTMVGEPLPADSLHELHARMPAYGLGDARLVIKQGSFKNEDVDVNAITSTVTDQIIKYSQASIARKDRLIDSLRRQIERHGRSGVGVADLRNELKTLMPDVQNFTPLAPLLVNATSNRPDTVMLVYAKFSRRHTLAERRRIERWLQSRTKSRKIKLIVE
jgi:hypothetical protein